MRETKCVRKRRGERRERKSKMMFMILTLYLQYAMVFFFNLIKKRSAFNFLVSPDVDILKCYGKRQHENTPRYLPRYGCHELKDTV